MVVSKNPLRGFKQFDPLRRTPCAGQVAVRLVRRAKNAMRNRSQNAIVGAGAEMALTPPAPPPAPGNFGASVPNFVFGV